MNSVALITGASGGLGFEFAKIFAKNKYDLLLVARSADKLGEVKNLLQSEYGVTVHILPKDLTDQTAADEVYAYAEQNGLKVCALVNNAGFGDFGAVKRPRAYAPNLPVRARYEGGGQG